MFTRCPHCDTVFKVTAEQLRLAHGEARCGNCAFVFNAVEWLSEHPPESSTQPETGLAGPPDFDQPQAGETTSAGADAARDDAHTPDNGPAPGDEGDPLEFDAPEDDWPEFFIEVAPADAPRRWTDTEAEESGDIPLDGELEVITANPNEWRELLGETLQAASAADESAPGEADAEPPEDEDDLPVFTIDETDMDESSATAGVHDGNDSSAVTAQANETPLIEDIDEDLALPWNGTPVTPRRPVTGWLIGSLLLAIVLAAQLVHMNRDRLAASPRWGSTVRAAYDRIGLKLFPQWPLDVFDVRRAEALAGGSSPDALEISAAIEVSGDRPVGLPLVRVSLRDQWANTIASGVFKPRDYLAADLPPIVPAGTRIPVHISLVDPGNIARGFEVDVCLPNRRAGLQCQQSGSPFVQ